MGTALIYSTKMNTTTITPTIIRTNVASTPPAGRSLIFLEISSISLSVRLSMRIWASCKSIPRAISACWISLRTSFVEDSCEFPDCDQISTISLSQPWQPQRVELRWTYLTSFVEDSCEFPDCDQISTISLSQPWQPQRVDLRWTLTVIKKSLKH